MKFKLLQHHIDEGKVAHPCSCPIARAIDEQLGHISEVAVGDTTVTIDNRKYNLPTNAVEFINRFDSFDLDVGPFEFELDMEDYEIFP